MTEAIFPLNSFREAATHLRRPFTPEAVKFKVQAVWPKDNPTGGLIVSYIDARLAVERLNLIVPHLWSDEYEPHQGFLLCRLTVDGITRQDVGEGVVKGLYSDALKRAAVKFGVGVSLYAIPKMMLNVSDGHLKQKKTPKGLTLELTPSGEQHVRSLYKNWLKQHGTDAFGEPLNHGDAEDSQGDPAEASDVPGGDVTPAAEPDVISMIRAAASEARLSGSDVAKVICGVTGDQVEWSTHKEARDWASARLAGMSEEERRKVLAAIEAPE